MTIALSTRSTCDECGNPAVLTCGDAFLCERCDREINGEVENSNSDASAFSRPDSIATAGHSGPSFPAVAPGSMLTQSVVADTRSPLASGLRDCQPGAAASEARSLGAALSFEDEVSALEARGFRDEACMLDILQIDGAIGLRGVHDA